MRKTTINHIPKDTSTHTQTQSQTHIKHTHTHTGSPPQTELLPDIIDRSRPVPLAAPQFEPGSGEQHKLASLQTHSDELTVRTERCRPGSSNLQLGHQRLPNKKAIGLFKLTTLRPKAELQTESMDSRKTSSVLLALVLCT